LAGLEGATKKEQAVHFSGRGRRPIYYGESKTGRRDFGAGIWRGANVNKANTKGKILGEGNIGTSVNESTLLDT